MGDHDAWDYGYQWWRRLLSPLFAGVGAEACAGLVWATRRRGAF